MHFLPIEINEQKVYAGFWVRLVAAVIDSLLFALLLVPVYYLNSVSIPVAIATAIGTSLLVLIYFVFMHYKFGATLGKMLVGIKVTLPDGCAIGIKHAMLRSAVDAAFVVLALWAQVTAFTLVAAEAYLPAGWVERGELLLPLYPYWYDAVAKVETAWYWSEVIVLLFNKRKRSLHDFIAGTVVIHKQFARTDNPSALSSSTIQPS